VVAIQPKTRGNGRGTQGLVLFIVTIQPILLARNVLTLHAALCQDETKVRF